MQRLAFIIFLTGLMISCIYVKSYAEDNNVGYEKFFDSRGDQKLVRRSNDIYLEKIDSSDSKQITHTPDIEETYASFSTDGKYILFGEGLGVEERGFYRLIAAKKHYRIKSDSDDNTKQEISYEEYESLSGKEAAPLK